VSAAEYINGAFNGQKGFRDHENCETCGNENAEKKCSNCKTHCDRCGRVFSNSPRAYFSYIFLKENSGELSPKKVGGNGR
jgi:hypothetical protein